jgi:hypothetical protein
MFTIQPYHMKAFAAAGHEDLEKKLAEFLCHEFPEASLQNHNELYRVIHEQHKKASHYELKASQEIAIYVITAWLLGVDFDTDFPAANDVLRSALPSHLKIHWLQNWTQEIFAILEPS